MNKSDTPVYISYRRSVSFYLTLALYHSMRAAGADVFMDTGRHEIRDALHFAQIEARPHFVVVLPPGLVEAMQRPNDPQRCEIEHAVSKRRNLVPLRAQGFNFRGIPSRVPMTDILRRYYALDFSPETLTQTITMLCESFFTRRIFGQITPTPRGHRLALERIKAEADAFPFPTDAELASEAIFNHGLARNRPDFEGKLTDYDEALRLNPDNVYVRFNRALARRRSGDELGALADYDEVLRVNPQFHKAYNNRAEIYFTQGAYDQALADYDQAIRLYDHYVMALAGKALTLHALDRIDEALDLWKPLLAQDQGFYDATWVGRELRLLPAMIDEAHRLTLRLQSLHNTFGDASADASADAFGDMSDDASGDVYGDLFDDASDD